MIWYFIAYYVVGVIASLIMLCIYENYSQYITLKDLIWSLLFMWAFAPIIGIFLGGEWLFKDSQSIKLWEKKE
jgi:hypothetical protein